MEFREASTPVSSGVMNPKTRSPLNPLHVPCGPQTDHGRQARTATPAGRSRPSAPCRSSRCRRRPLRPRRASDSRLQRSLSADPALRATVVAGWRGDVLSTCGSVGTAHLWLARDYRNVSRSGGADESPARESSRSVVRRAQGRWSGHLKNSGSQAEARRRDTCMVWLTIRLPICGS